MLIREVQARTRDFHGSTLSLSLSATSQKALMWVGYGHPSPLVRFLMRSFLPLAGKPRLCWFHEVCRQEDCYEGSLRYEWKFSQW